MMRKVISVKETPITTVDGLRIIRRETTVQMPNGKYRKPVIYFDGSNETVRIGSEERDRVRIPVYDYLI